MLASLTDALALQPILAQQPAEYRTSLIERCVFTLKSDVRKAKAWERWCIYTEQHAPLILDRIVATQNDPGIRAEIAKFVDLTVNPGLDVTRQTAVCWRQGARRSIEGATEDQLSAFHELVLESRIDTYAPAWNRIASLVGPVVVAPAIRNKALRWDTLLPTFAEVETDPEDIYGTPRAVAWTIRDQCEDPNNAVAVVLDNESWTTYSIRPGERLSNGSDGPPTVAIAKPPVEHGLGYTPISTLRFDAVIDGDWWGSPFLNQRLIDATVAIGVLNAALAFTRKAQNKKLLTLIGDLGGFPDGQSLDPEVPFIADVPSGAGVAPTIQAIDFDTDPDRFIKHASWIYRNIADAYGGQVEADPSGITSRVVFPVEALTEIRNEQIPQARQFERDLWAAAVDLCRKFGHPLAQRLPSREQVLEGFRIDFGKLSRRFAEPKAEQEWIDWLLSKGSTDQLEILRAQGNSTLDDKQLKELAEHYLGNQSWFNNLLATRNLSLIDGKVQSTPQANGAKGPAVRDGKPLAIAGALPGPQGADGFAATPGATDVDVDAEVRTLVQPTDGEHEALAVAGADVQAAALNGAQISSFIELATAFSNGSLPLELGERFLPIAFPGAVRNEAAARRLLEPLRGFKPPQPESNGTDVPGDDNGERDRRDRDRDHGDAGGEAGSRQAGIQGSRRREEAGTRGRSETP